MIASVIFWGQLIAGLIVLLVALSAIWPWVKNLFPKSVSDVIDRVSDYADEAAAGAGLASIALLAKKHGDAEAVKMAGALWVKVMTWDDEPAITPKIGV